MYESLYPLRFARFQFTIEALEALQLPDYKGSALRGGFGYAFKKATCLSRDRQCEQCLLKTACAYYTVFETKISKETATLLRIGADAPHPFILEPPMTDERTFPQGSTLSYGLTLVGSAIEKLPFFMYAFWILGEDLGLGKGRGRFRLVSVRDGDGTVIYKNETLSGNFKVYTAKEMLGADKPEESVLALELLTPLRMKTAWQRETQGLLTAITDNTHFRILLKALYHRAFVLTQLYCTDKPVERYDSREVPLVDAGVQLSQSKTRWIDWTRYSTRQKQQMQLGGMTGTVVFTGETGKYLPLFRLGEFLHIGKGSTFGLGKYRLFATEPDNNHE